MLNVATLISRTDSDLGRPMPRDASTSSLNLWLGWVVKARTNLEALQSKEKALLANRNFSDEGRSIELAKLATEALNAWKWIGIVLQGLRTDLSQQRARLYTIDPNMIEKNELIRAWRAREIRDALSALNSNDRDVRYLQASEGAQLEILLAMQTAPTGSMVSVEVQERADRERARNAQPDAFEAHLQTEILHERLAGFVDHVGQMFRAYGVARTDVVGTLGLVA